MALVLTVIREATIRSFVRAHKVGIGDAIALQFAPEDSTPAALNSLATY